MGSSPGWSYAYVPTPAQWNAAFAAKQDDLGYTPVNRAGDTMSGPLITTASTAAGAGFAISVGVAPNSPQDGDIWFTSTGIFARVNGTTIGPISTGTVIGPSSSAVDNIAVFSTTNGRGIADSGLAVDNVMTITTGVYRIPSFREADLAVIPDDVDRVYVEAYDPTPDDPATVIGGAYYKVVDTEPSYDLKFPNGGRWWAVDEVLLQPEMAGAVGDGTADDSDACIKIVYAAYLLGTPVNWTGAYLTNDSIPYMHDITHVGHGRVLRGSDTWYITPTGSQRNVAYYATTGADANDGLSADFPRLTIANAATLLMKYGCEGRMLNGRWRIQFGAGVWLDQILRIGSALESRYRIEIFGTLDEDGTPLTVWEHTGTSILNVVHIEPEGQYEFRNIWAKGVDNTQFASYGFLGKSKVDIAYYDCRVTGKSIGYAIINQSEGYFERCWAISCSDGFRGTYSSTVSVGLLPGSTCRALNCTTAGAFISRNSTGHVDYFNPEDCGIGVLIDMNARAAITSGDFKRCSVGVQTWGGGEWADGGTPPNFNTGTPDACTVTFRAQGAGGETKLYAQNSQSYHRIGMGVGPWSTDSTSAATLTNVVAPPAGGRPLLPGYFFADSGKSLRIRAWGTLSGAAITKTLRLSVLDYATQANAAQIFNLNLGNGEGEFDIDCLIVAQTSGSQYQSRRIITPLGTVLTQASTSVPFTADRMLRFYGLLGASGGQITLNGYEVFLAG